MLWASRDGLLARAPALHPERLARAAGCPPPSSAVADATARSVRFSFGLDAVTHGRSTRCRPSTGLRRRVPRRACGPGCHVDPAFGRERVAAPAAASGRRTLTLVNAGAADAARDPEVPRARRRRSSAGRDSRSSSGGTDRSWLSRSSSASFFGRNQAYGALSVLVVAPHIIVQSETSTPPPAAARVGQALARLRPSRLRRLDAEDARPDPRERVLPHEPRPRERHRGAAHGPRRLSTRPTGRPIGERDVDLPPLGMTQINRVRLGARRDDARRRPHRRLDAPPPAASSPPTPPSSTTSRTTRARSSPAERGSPAPCSAE